MTDLCISLSQHARIYCHTLQLQRQNSRKSCSKEKGVGEGWGKQNNHDSMVRDPNYTETQSQTEILFLPDQVRAPYPFPPEISQITETMVYKLYLSGVK